MDDRERFDDLLDLDSLLDSLGSDGNGVSSESGNIKSSGQDAMNMEPKPDSSVALRRPSGGRIALAVFVALLFSLVFARVCYLWYMSTIKYPDAIDVTWDSTGLACLEDWEASVASLEGVEGGYLSQEIVYANDDSEKIDFYRKMASTVSYSSYPVENKNVYGNTLIGTDDTVQYRESTVGVGEYVITSFVDYNRIKIDRNVVSVLMNELDLRVGDVDYTNRLVDVFVQYMNRLDTDDIPIRSVRRIPFMSKTDAGYSMDLDEDIWLDRVLFSSEPFYRLLERFSVVASSIGVSNPEWESWNALGDAEKTITPEPSRELQKISPTEEWLAWDSLSVEEKASRDVSEPEKYPWKEIMNSTWCGAFYLQNEYTVLDSNGNVVHEHIDAEIGDGSFDDPAGLNTDVVTSVFVGGEEYPISIRLIEYGISEDAIRWFEAQDVRNRGIDVSSEVQYIYYVFEVTNLSSSELTIRDNSSLSDRNANVTSRTGTMFGIQDSVVLQPDETGVIESWGRSTELNLRYVIWGADFARRVDPVWFRLLAGNIADPSENKGVSINDSRNNTESAETKSSSMEFDSEE